MTAVSHDITSPRWRRRPEERPRQIVDAALAIFGEHGLAASRLDDIAKRAGLSKGTIYLYFPNKEELFREVVRQTVVAQIEQAEREFGASTGSATEALVSFMRGYWDFVRSPAFASLFRLINSEIHNFPDLAQFYAQEVVARKQRLISAVIRRGVDAGEFRDVEPMLAARMLSAPMVMHALWCNHRECFTTIARKSDKQVFNEIMNFYLHAIRADNGNGKARSRGHAK